MKIRDENGQIEPSHVFAAIVIVGGVIVLAASAVYQLAWVGLAALIFAICFSAFGPGIGTGIQSARKLWDGASAHEKVDKLAKALGLKWQRIPERRRWVTMDTPEPEREDEQPQILRLESRSDG